MLARGLVAAGRLLTKREKSRTARENSSREGSRRRTEARDDKGVRKEDEAMVGSADVTMGKDLGVVPRHVAFVMDGNGRW